MPDFGNRARLGGSAPGRGAARLLRGDSTGLGKGTGASLVIQRGPLGQ